MRGSRFRPSESLLSMLPSLATASNALVATGQRLEALASVVATATAGASAANGTQPSGPVRIGDLPVASPLEAMVSLKEAELAYKMNAAVLATTAEMFDSLLDVITPDER